MERKTKRCYHDYTHDVLKLALKPINSTELFWRSRVSGKILEPLKKALLDAGMLEVEEGKLHTTDKGKQFIRAYRRVEKLWSDKARLRVSLNKE